MKKETWVSIATLVRYIATAVIAFLGGNGLASCGHHIMSL